MISLSVLGFALLVNFQNCAPARPVDTSSASNGSGGDLRLIDEFGKVEIQFAAPEVIVQDDATQASVMGICQRAHNGGKLHFFVHAGAGGVVLEGMGVCQAGGFTLQLSGLDQVVCGVDHQITVEGEWGASAFARFERRCQPLASEMLAFDQQTPPASQCFLEYTPSGEVDSSPCARSCYRQGVMIGQLSLDPAQCSGLAARLAGP